MPTNNIPTVSSLHLYGHSPTTSNADALEQLSRELGPIRLGNILPALAIEVNGTGMKYCSTQVSVTAIYFYFERD